MIQSTFPEASGLGEKLAEQKHAGSKGCALVLCAGLFLFGLFMIGLAVSLRPFSGASVAALVVAPLVVIGPSIYGFVRSWRTRDLQIIAYENGLTHTVGGQTDVIPWDDITYVWQNIPKVTDELIAFPPSGEVARTRLELTDGRQITIRGGFTSREEVGTIIRAGSLPCLAMRAAEAYDRGEAVPFGPIGLSRSGISFHRQSISWDQVAGARIDSGKLTIFEKFGDRVRISELLLSEGRGKKWRAVKSGLVPNLMVLLLLVNTVALAEAPTSIQLSDVLAQAMTQSPQQEPVAEAA